MSVKKAARKSIKKCTAIGRLSESDCIVIIIVIIVVLLLLFPSDYTANVIVHPEL